jgi:hypothetical protein
MHCSRQTPASASTVKLHSVIGSSRSPAIPLDTIKCGGNVDKPYQFGKGAPVAGEANIFCTPHAPDVCSITVRVWRYDATQKKYYIVAEHTSNYCGTNWWVKATGNCTAKIAYAMHTEVVGQLFYGNWIDLGPSNSPAVTLYC